LPQMDSEALEWLDYQREVHPRVICSEELMTRYGNPA